MNLKNKNIIEQKIVHIPLINICSILIHSIISSGTRYMARSRTFPEETFNFGIFNSTAE